MEGIVINIDTLVKYQILINTTGEPNAVAAAVNSVMAQLLESVTEATKASSPENRG